MKVKELIEKLSLYPSDSYITLEMVGTIFNELEDHRSHLLNIRLCDIQFSDSKFLQSVIQKGLSYNREDLFGAGVAIPTIKHLTQKTRHDLLVIPNMGKHCVKAIETYLATLGLTLLEKKRHWESRYSDGKLDLGRL